MKKTKQTPSKAVSVETVSKVEKVMKRHISKKTNTVTLTRDKIAEKANVNVRTVDAVIQSLKFSNSLKRGKEGYQFN